MRIPDLARRLPLVRAVLFGSWARGRHTAASDIDILVVYEGDHREDAYAVVKKTLAVPGVEPHVYSEREAAAAADQLARMTTDGIVLYP